MALRPKSSGARARYKATRTETGGGRPVVIAGARERAAGLRIDWSGRGHPGMEQASWQDWFRRFDEQGLAFVFRERTGSGELSRFCKLMPRAAAERQSRTGRNKPKVRTAGG